MSRTTRRPSLVRGRVARVTRLDSCGRFVYGEYNQAVTDGVITVTFTANTNTTDEISVVKMDGKRCVYEPSLPELSGYSIDVQFCAVEPDIFEMITGQRRPRSSNSVSTANTAALALSESKIVSMIRMSEPPSTRPLAASR